MEFSNNLWKLRDRLHEKENINYVDILFSVLLVAYENRSTRDLNRHRFLFFLRRFLLGIMHKMMYFLNYWLGSKLKKVDFLFFVSEPTEIKQLLNIFEIIHNSQKYLITTNKVNLFSQLKNDLNRFMIGKRFANYPGSRRKVFKAIKQMDGFSAQEKIFIKQFVDIRIPFIDSLYKQFEEILVYTQPKFVFVGYDITPEGRLLTLLCKRRGIPTFNIQHGIIPYDMIHREHLVDKLFVYGEASKKRLIEIGVDPSRIVVSGAPYLDHVPVMNSAHQKKSILSSLGIDTTKGFILIATSGPGHRTSVEHFDSQVKAFMQLSTAYPSEYFIVKLHRKDALINYTKWQEMYPGSRLILVSYDTPGYPENIFDWVAQCKAVITGNSASASEALLMNKPVFTVDLNNEYKGVDFIEAGATIHCMSESDLIENFGKFLNDHTAFSDVKEKAKNFISEYFYKLDGKASERIIQYVTNYKTECVA